MSATVQDRDRLNRIKADFAGTGVGDEDIYWLIQRAESCCSPEQRAAAYLADTAELRDRRNLRLKELGYDDPKKDE